MKACFTFLSSCLMAGQFFAQSAGAEPTRFGSSRTSIEIPASTTEKQEIRRLHLLQELRRAQVHARLARDAVPDATPDVCPALDSSSGYPGMLQAGKRSLGARPARYALAQPASTMAGPPMQSAQDVFKKHLSGQVVQTKCIRCHVKGGLSDYTRLVFETGSVPDHQSKNLAVFETFISTVPSGADLILEKVRGIAHGGATQVASGTLEFASMERFLRLLERATHSTGLSSETLFDGVTMASPAKTLWRAALIFAGRVPTEAELNAVNDGQISSLRQAIRGVLRGKGFHDFLIRSSNDRLLTDRHLFSVFDFRSETDLVDLANLNWRESQRAVDRGYERAIDDPLYNNWESSTQYGISRAPLELIAYVVENDLAYTEILTADYIMANPAASKGYGSLTDFDDPKSEDEFRPSRIVNYFRNDFSKVSEFDVRYGTRIVNSGNLRTRYPHAGILNTRVYLRRYPTTATNRNRARARWTLFHFLGIDVENMASRPTDTLALTDTNSPTVSNPSCTACHAVLDPVAGAFQNYDEGGSYKSAFGGVDSLPDTYKFPSRGASTLYRPGDTWYRDMFAPGFEGEVAPDSDDSVQWLAKKIAADLRFSSATVEFWWPAVMGTEVAKAPIDGTANLAQGRLLEARAQSAEVERLANAFRAGMHGGKPYNLRDLLSEMALSPWFRAESIGVEDPNRLAALRDAGIERLLSPEELARKTDSITGYRWGRHTSGFIHEVGNLDGEGYGRGGEYELLYGGIDSDGVAKRARSVTPLMAAVAQSHAIRTSCAIVQREFYMWSDQQRRLFDGITAHATPVSGLSASVAGLVPQTRGEGAGAFPPAQTFPSGPAQIRKKLVDLHWKLLGVTVPIDSPDIEVAYRLFVNVWERKRETEGPGFRDSKTMCPIDDNQYFDGIINDVVVTDERGNSVIDWNRVKESWTFDMYDPNYTVRTWVVVLSFLMSDYRYLYL